jgi:hypothetical protein
MSASSAPSPLRRDPYGLATGVLVLSTLEPVAGMGRLVDGIVRSVFGEARP